MFKTKEEVIVIQAEAKEPIPTRAVFWSHDKGTAKMLFKLRKDGTSQALAEGTIVPVLLKFNSGTAEGGVGRHIYHAVIEDAVNGIVSIVLEDNILGYQGRVDGSIYIELPDSRSLDTAGRFTFHIKRSPIDEDVPELEDYYWQGFSEIMEQYNESIAEIKSEAKELLDSLTADVTKAQNKVTTLEQSITTANTNLNTRINEINKKIDDNDVFTKQESSANVIYQIVGREKVRMNITLDFKDKIRGSIEKNLNFLSHTSNLDLSKKPDNYTYESEQHRYDKISILDGASDKISTVEANNIPGYVATYPILDVLKSVLGEQFFLDRKASDLESDVQVVRNLVKKISYTVNGFGVSDGKGNLTCQLFTETGGGRWLYSKTTNALSTAEIRNDVSEEDTRYCLDANGKSYLRVYANVSSETAVSTVSLDYLKLDFEIEISVNDHIKSMIAQNHVDNLATQTEATTATDNTKTMTPLRTSQAIDKRAVTIAGNQTVGGIKNFKDGVLLDDVPVFGITRNVVFNDAEVGGYFNAVDKISLGAVGKIDKVVLVWSRVDDSAGTLLNYSWSQTVLFPDDIILGNSYRVQLTSENYKFITFKNESGILTISGSNENSVAPNRIYRIKRIVAYIKK